MCKVGSRCHICTGCGRCFDHKDGIHVITGSGLNENSHNELLPVDTCQKFCNISCNHPEKTIAVDIGTTTIAMLFYDQLGREEDCFVTVNPQVKYGADVLSRIQAAGDSEVAKDMNREVREVLARGIRQFREKQNGVQSEDVPCCELQDASTQHDLAENAEFGMMIGANTTMVYLLLGLDPAELGRAPFHASHLGMQGCDIEGVKGIILPGLSAFVGSDILAGIYACDMAKKEEITLLIDLGTNGEMAIGSSKGIIACSTAAGPAFEGGATKGVWGADMVHLTAELLKAGVLDETGLMENQYFEQGILIGNTRITQKSIRDLQLAKAAIAAGIRILAEAYGLESMEQIDRVVLAGGFGYYLQALDAVEIGLLPAQLISKVISGGNTVLAGIRKIVLEGLGRDDADSQLGKIVNMTKVINLAEQDGFQDKYIEAMNLKKW